MYKIKNLKTRIEVAKQQYDYFTKIQNGDEIVDQIIVLTNDYLAKTFGITTISDPKIHLTNGKFSNGIKPKEFYALYKSKYNLDDVRDIVWMKFTKDFCLTTVACSNDINVGDNNTSGKILKKLNLQYNGDFVLVFPLSGIGGNKHLRHQIEMEIGDNLIINNIPIIDFYSHRFHTSMERKEWYIKSKNKFFDEYSDSNNV